MQKIMFNSKLGLERAVLEGRKTMIRRSVSDKILNKYQDYLNWWNTQNGGFKVPEDEFYLCESPLKVNDVIAIAQAYKDVNCGGCDVDCRYDSFRTAYSVGCVRESDKGWNNKMFVYADLMPHHIKITNVRVERLQDISDEDCLREGIMKGEFMNTWDTFYYDEWGDVPNHITFKTPREAFAALIDKVSGKGTWDSNPWCFCYEFKLID